MGALRVLPSPIMPDRPQNDSQSRHTLRGMHRVSRDIRRTGRTRHQHSIFALSESRVLIGIVNVLNDLIRVEQNHYIVRKKTDGVYAKLVFREQH